MRQIHEQANKLVEKLQIIADAISEYNPGLRKDKTSLDVIQHNLACLGWELTWLYSEIGTKIKKD